MLELSQGYHWAKTRAHERPPPQVLHLDGVHAGDDDLDHDQVAFARAAEQEDEENEVHVEWVAVTREIPSGPRTNATTRRVGTPLPASSASRSRPLGSHGSHAGGSSLSSLGSSQGSSHRGHGNDDNDDEDDVEGIEPIVIYHSHSAGSSSSRGGGRLGTTSQERTRRSLEEPDEFDIGLSAAARRRFGTYHMIVDVVMYNTLY